MAKRTHQKRIIKFADVYERQVEKKDRVKAKKDKFYFDRLDELLDILFETAYERGLTWGQIAKGGGLAYTTVVNLGERFTKRPQLRTVMLVADALDMALFAEHLEERAEEPKIVLRAVG